VGFVTRGRGVSVHRAECPNVARLAEERRLEAHWGELPTNTRFSVDVELSGEGGAALLRDVADVLGRDRVPLRATRSAGRGRDERLRLSLEVTDQAQLDRVLASLRALPRVSAARRC
jgi:GTP pyrophosphokinase